MQEIAGIDGHPAHGIQARVADALRLAIVRGAYAPGAALSELALAEELRVSRTPVREALKQLETEGLVRIVPRVGTFVTEPSPREIGELLELRECFAGLAARLLAARADDAACARLDQLLDVAAAALAAGDVEAAAAATSDITEAVVLAADSTKLAQTYRWHMNQLADHRLGEADALDLAAATRIVEGLRRVRDALVARDGDAAEFAMRDVARGARRDHALAVARAGAEVPA